MSTFQEIDPTKFIDQVKKLPETGRGAWTKRGIGFDTRYRLSPTGTPRLGSECEKSLDHWAIGAGVYAIRARLVKLGFTDAAEGDNIGKYGTAMDEAVRAFQAKNADPRDGRKLAVDGIVGTTDARALFTPLIDASAKAASVPGSTLRGLLNHESLLDPGAVGYYIYYMNQDGTTRFGGVDRGLEQNNSKANPTVPWELAFDADWAIRDAGTRFRGQYDKLKKAYPKRDDSVLWDAAVASHNSPANGQSWAKLGAPPTVQSANYVASVYKAVY